MPKNEREIEQLFEKELNELGYTDHNGWIIKPQVKIKNASKTGKGFGAPEFVITHKENKEIIIYVECKKEGIKVDKALEEAQHYLKKDVVNYRIKIAVGVSYNYGKLEIKDSLFKNNKWESIIGDKMISATAIFSYLNDNFANVDNDLIIDAAIYLSNYLRAKSIEAADRPTLIAGILSAMTEKDFLENWKIKKTNSSLAEYLMQVLETILNDGKFQQKKKNSLLNKWRQLFMSTKISNDSKIDYNNLSETSILGHTLQTLIDSKVKDAIDNKVNFDIIGEFYSNFMSYTSSDGSDLGIVLTPKHITKLMAQLINLTPNDVLLDPCAGTGSFLVAGMNIMNSRSHGNLDLLRLIKEKGLIGIENSDNMYTLASGNMILHGDGKSNMYLGSCFDPNIIDDIKNNKKPNKLLMNPPYSQSKKEGLGEFNFVHNALNMLQNKGLGAAIVPLSMFLNIEEFNSILKDHRCISVIRMNNEIFYPTSTVVAIVIFEAHSPHFDLKGNSILPTWFADLQDDGFGKHKTKGRVDIKSKWEGIQSEFLKAFENKVIIPGRYQSKKLSLGDEFTVEAQLDTNTAGLSIRHFDQSILDFSIYKIKKEMKSGGSND